jgi:hypothetical protein
MNDDKHCGHLFLPRHRHPKVLLLGNGLNRVYGGASWAGLLARINRTSYTPEQVKGLPLPMQAVLLSEDHVDLSLKELGQDLTRSEVHPWLAEQLSKLLAMPFDCILTPNFTYELEQASDPTLWGDSPKLKRCQRHTPAVKRAENRFMLSTYYDLPVEDGRRRVPLFHIHGEARKPDSVILGHYFYGTLLFSYDDYLTRYAPKRQYRVGRDPRGMEAMSWLDYFILGDVYSLGFGFDTAEMDLWWLLCRKKRERAAHGEVYVFEPSRRTHETKRGLLRAYDAQCIDLGYAELDNDGYREFYQVAVEEIGRRVSR